MTNAPSIPDLRSIPIDEIKVVNPRQRSASGHAAIIENIRLTGLRRPITVSKRPTPDGPHKYDLVCGQGRLEAYVKLERDTIPAVVIEVSAEDGLVMSLVENVARRHRSSLEMMQEIQALRSRGHTHEAIGKMIGAGTSWVTGVLGLLENGEERLVTSVAIGLLPISLATQIATGTTHEMQIALADAYETGVLRGKPLAMVRRVLKLRERSKLIGSSTASPGGSASARDWTPAELIKIYEREAAEKRLIVTKAAMVESLLTFTVEAFKQLLKDDEFVSLLKSEGLLSMPKHLSKLLATDEVTS